MKRKIISIVLALSLCLGLLSPAFAAVAPDVADDFWGAEIIERAIELGILKGDVGSGNIRPNDPITRGEFIAVVNRALGYTVAGDPEVFADYDADLWYAGDVSKAVAQGYLSGVKSGDELLVNGDKNITRQEAFAIVRRVVKLTAGGKTDFLDSNDIAAWAVGDLAAMQDAGYITGYLADGGYTVSPTANISRVEAVTVLLNALGIVLNAEGEYTLDEVEGNVTVTAGGVVLGDTVIGGNLFITEGVGTGDVYFNNVTISGSVIIAGGGSNSVHFTNCEIGTLVYESDSGYLGERTRIVLDGGTVECIEIADGAVAIITAGEEAAVIGTIIVPEDSAIIVDDSIDLSETTVIAAPGATVTLVDAEGAETTYVVAADEDGNLGLYAVDEDGVVADEPTDGIVGAIEAIPEPEVDEPVEGGEDEGEPEGETEPEEEAKEDETGGSDLPPINPPGPGASTTYVDTALLAIADPEYPTLEAVADSKNPNSLFVRNVSGSGALNHWVSFLSAGYYNLFDFAEVDAFDDAGYPNTEFYKDGRYVVVELAVEDILGAEYNETQYITIQQTNPILTKYASTDPRTEGTVKTKTYSVAGFNGENLAFLLAEGETVTFKIYGSVTADDHTITGKTLIATVTVKSQINFTTATKANAVLVATINAAASADAVKVALTDAYITAFTELLDGVKTDVAAAIYTAKTTPYAPDTNWTTVINGLTQTLDGGYYRITDAGVSKYMKADGTFSSSIGDIVLIAANTKIAASHVVTKATAYSEASHGAISITNHVPDTSITLVDNEGNLDLPSAGFGNQYEVNLINFLGTSSTDNTPNARVGTLGSSKFAYAIIGREGTGPFYILYDEHSVNGWVNGKMSHNGSALPDGDTCIYKADGYQSVGTQYKGYVFYLPADDEVDRTYVFNCDDGTFVFLNITVAAYVAD